MERLFEALRPVIRFVVRRPWLVLGVAALLTALGLYSASHLRIDMDLANLIPQDYASVQALEKLRNTVGGESDVAVAIVSPSFEHNQAFAEALIPRALAMKQDDGEPFLTRVEYRRDTEFLKDNALYFATLDEIDSLETFLEDKIEEASLEANPFFFDLEDEDEADASAEPAATPDGGMALATVYDDIVGKEYAVSEDSTVLVLRFFPSGAQTNIGFIENLYESLDETIAETNPEQYDPAMQVTTAGRLLRQSIEVRAITNDVFGSFGAGVSAVLLMVIVYFFYKGVRARSKAGFSWRIFLSELARTPLLAFIIGIPLFMSLSWTFGLAYLAFGALNLMTSTLGLVLFGLGIDYGIHFYARYTEERGHGHGVAEAAEITFASTGQAVAIGAFTTAAALYVLVFADFKGFSEFGFIAGTGIMLALISMTLVLPALLSLFEQYHLLNLGSASLTPVLNTNGHAERMPFARPLVIGSFLAVALALVFVPRVQFEYNFGKLEPVYKAYNERADVIGLASSGGNGGRNPAYIVVDNPSEVTPIVEAIRKYAASDTLTPSIGRVESLQERFPSEPEQQRIKLARIADIRALLANPFVEAEESEDLDRLRRASGTTAAISIDEVPESIKKQFMTRSGSFGTFVMIYPSAGLSDGRESMKFAQDVGTVITADGSVYHAGSTSLVAADMLRLMMAEAPWMVGATFLLVVALMFINFRSIKWATLALIPLVVGLLWMMLVMEVLDLKLNFYNLVVLPAILGIGNDAGVHIVHRYREEGPGSLLHVLRSTGEHISMASLTTMVGFGGLLLSFHPGLHSIGSLAVAGIAMTLLAALIFLPALLQWIEDRDLRSGRLVATSRPQGHAVEN